MTKQQRAMARPPMQSSETAAGKRTVATAPPVTDDSDLENFRRAPYDPLYSARAGGRMTGLLARNSPLAGWQRVLAFLLACSLIGIPLAGLLQLLLGHNLASGLPLLLIGSPFGYSGCYLFWRPSLSQRSISSR